MADDPIHPESADSKSCSRCSERKPRSDFRSYPNGKIQSYCRPCESAYKAAWYAKNATRLKAQAIKWNRANKERKASIDRDYRKANRDRCFANGAAWVKRNPEKRKESWRKWYAKNRVQADAATKKWIKEHPHHVSERSRRLKASRKEAYVKWANRDAMAAMYEEAARLTKETGTPHEVDHIVPLTSKVVCGLHWEGNMRVVPRFVNRSKNNKFVEALAV